MLCYIVYAIITNHTIILYAAVSSCSTLGSDRIHTVINRRSVAFYITTDYAIWGGTAHWSPYFYKSCTCLDLPNRLSTFIYFVEQRGCTLTSGLREPAHITPPDGVVNSKRITIIRSTNRESPDSLDCHSATGCKKVSVFGSLVPANRCDVPHSPSRIRDMLPKPFVLKIA